MVAHWTSKLCPGSGHVESRGRAGCSYRCPSHTGCRSVKRCTSPLQLFLAPTHCAWKSLRCFDRRSSAHTCGKGSTRSATYLDRLRSGNGRASGSFQDSRLHGGVSSIAFSCHPSLAPVQTLPLDRLRRVCVGGG